MAPHKEKRKLTIATDIPELRASTSGGLDCGTDRVCPANDLQRIELFVSLLLA